MRIFYTCERKERNRNFYFLINMIPPKETEFLEWVANARALDLLIRGDVIRACIAMNDSGVAKEKSTAQG